MEKALVIPHKMALAAWEAQESHHKSVTCPCVPGSPCSLEVGLRGAIEWLAKNPTLPATMIDQVACMIWSFNLDRRPEIGGESALWIEEHEAVKRIYRSIAQLACKITFAQAFKPEPAIPKDLADLVIVGALDLSINMSRGGLNALLLEAYSRGKQAQPSELTGSLPAPAMRA